MSDDRMTERDVADDEHLSLYVVWLDGYDRAVAVMRAWADKFGNAQCKLAVRDCADMVEAAKPPPSRPRSH